MISRYGFTAALLVASAGLIWFIIAIAVKLGASDVTTAFILGFLTGVLTLSVILSLIASDKESSASNGNHSG